MPVNAQGLTPEQMSNIGSQETPQTTITKAQYDPGTLQVGAVTGSTPTNGMIAPTATNYEAYKAPDAVKTAVGDTSGTLTSQPAQTYLQSLSSDAERLASYGTSGQAYTDINSSDASTRLNANRAILGQKEQDLNNYAKQVEGGAISTSSKDAYVRQLPPSDPTETPQEKELRRIVENGGAAGLSAGQALTTLLDLRKDRQKFDVQNKNFSDEQISEEATSRVGAFRMGQSGGSYAASAASKLKEQQDQQKTELADKQRDYLNAAKDSAWSGNLKMAEQFRSEANRTFEQRLALEQEARAEQAQTLQLQQYEDQRSEKAQDRAMSTVGNLVKAGYTVDQIPKSYLDELDANSGMPKGFTSQLFDVAQSEKEAAALQGEEEQRTKRIENAQKIVNILKETPTGGSVNIEGVEYAVQGKTPEYTTGTEIDDNGNGVLWSFNKTTGEVSTTPLGQIGSKKDGWETQTLGDGSIWRINPKTGQSQPFYASQAQTTWNAVLPEGETGPVLPGNPAAAGQCAAMNNFCYGTRILADSFSQKKEAFATNNPVSKEELEVGDSFLMSAGTTGHVGIINSIDHGPDGKIVLKMTESNYVPPGAGLMSHSRTMSIDDPKLKAFARIPTPNLPLAGPDSEVTRIASGGVSPSILGAGTKATNKDLPSSVQEYEYAQSTGFKGSYVDWKKGVDSGEQSDVTALANAAVTDPKILEGLTPTVLTQVKAQMARTGTSAAPKSPQASKEIYNLAKDILGDSSLGASVGPISSHLPTVRGSSADFKGKVNQLKSLLTLDNLGVMKGVLSDTDIKILTNAATSLDFGLSEKGFKKELQRIMEKVSPSLTVPADQGVESAKNKYNLTY